MSIWGTISDYAAAAISAVRASNIAATIEATIAAPAPAPAPAPTLLEKAAEAVKTVSESTAEAVKTVSESTAEAVKTVSESTAEAVKTVSESTAEAVKTVSERTGVSSTAMLIGAGVAGVTVAGVAAYKIVSQRRRARAQQEAIDLLATKVSEDVFNAIHQNSRLVAVVNGMNDAALGVLNRFDANLADQFARSKLDVFATAKNKARVLTKLAEKLGIALLEIAPQTKAQADAARAPVVSAEAAPAEAAPARSWVPGFGFARSAASRVGSTVSTAANAVWSRVPSLRRKASE